MSNRTSNKYRQRKENLKANKPTTFSSAPNKIWFWLFFLALVSAIGYLSYQAYASNLPSELIIPIAVVVILLLVLIIWYLPKFYVQSLPNEAGKTFDRENAKLKLEDDTRKTFAQIVGGAVLLGGLVFTFNTFRLQQEGQFTDRFTKAVTQIGDDKLEVRLGGLYALERIAKDSPKDHWTVMEILSAYVREKAKKKEEPAKNTPNTRKEIVNISNEKETVTNGDIYEVYQSKEPIKIATDVQAALTIIGRRKTEQDPKTDKINLSGTDLSGADLSKSNLSGANLRKTNLIGTNLTKSNLTGIDLTDADLANADLSDSSLSQAKIIRVNLIGSNLRRADLHKVELISVTLHHAFLDDANLQSVDFYDVDLSEAILFGADLRNADIYFANLDKTNLNYADLRATNILGKGERKGGVGGKLHIRPAEADLPFRSELVHPRFEQLTESIIDENTELDNELDTRKAELLEFSKANLETRERRLNKQ
jgi:uncharacterized protein YjbI with pentapeptide repeats